MNEITLTIELASVLFTSKLSVADCIRFKVKPKIFLHKMNKRLRPGLSLLVVNNESDLVNLVLPYYSDLAESQKASMATEEALERIVGGIGGTCDRSTEKLKQRVNNYMHTRKFLSNTINALTIEENGI